jgi:shikimate dehydrogenase
MSTSTTDRYAVIGNPIAHSKSPQIHQAFAQQTGDQLVYTAELVELGGVEAFVKDFAANNGKGLNVTVPFKQDAFQIATELSPRAQRAGAVNTLKLHGDIIYGDTTDGVGLLNDLTQNHQIQLKDKRILIVGAGGAVRGVLEPLLLATPQQLVIANRTLSKAEQLAQDFASFGAISASSFAALAGERFDLVINGTSASLAGELPPLPEQLFAAEACAYDMMYGAEPTAFLNWAAQQGAEDCYDGLGMLVEQAAESFYIWRKKRPETRGVIEQLRSQL